MVSDSTSSSTNTVHTTFVRSTPNMYTSIPPTHVQLQLPQLAAAAKPSYATQSTHHPSSTNPRATTTIPSQPTKTRKPNHKQPTRGTTFLRDDHAHLRRFHTGLRKQETAQRLLQTGPLHRLRRSNQENPVITLSYHLLRRRCQPHQLPTHRCSGHRGKHSGLEDRQNTG